MQRVLETAGRLGWNTTVIPSYRMRAGHPILLPRGLWPEILNCSDTLRTVLAAHRDQTHYLDVDTPTVLADLDTPEDYAAGNWQQNAGSR